MTQHEDAQYPKINLLTCEDEQLVGFDEANALRGIIEIFVQEDEDMEPEIRDEYRAYHLKTTDDFRLPGDTLKSEVDIDLMYVESIKDRGTFSLMGFVSIRPDRNIVDVEKEIHFHIAAHRWRLAAAKIKSSYYGIDNGHFSDVLKTENHDMSSYDNDELIAVLEAVLEFDTSDVTDR